MRLRRDLQKDQNGPPGLLRHLVRLGSRSMERAEQLRCNGNHVVASGAGLGVPYILCLTFRGLLDDSVFSNVTGPIVQEDARWLFRYPLRSSVGRPAPEATDPKTHLKPMARLKELSFCNSNSQRVRRDLLWSLPTPQQTARRSMIGLSWDVAARSWALGRPRRKLTY